MVTGTERVPVFLSPDDLVERWGGQMMKASLAQWRARRTGPAYVKLGGKVLYDLADIEAYEARQRRTGTRGV